MFRTCFDLLVAIIGLAIIRMGVKAPNWRREPDGSPNPLHGLVPDMPEPPPPPPPKKGNSWP